MCRYIAQRHKGCNHDSRRYIDICPDGKACERPEDCNIQHREVTKPETILVDGKCKPCQDLDILDHQKEQQAFQRMRERLSKPSKSISEYIEELDARLERSKENPYRPSNADPAPSRAYDESTELVPVERVRHQMLLPEAAPQPPQPYQGPTLPSLPPFTVDGLPMESMEQYTDGVRHSKHEDEAKIDFKREPGLD